MLSAIEQDFLLKLIYIYWCRGIRKQLSNIFLSTMWAVGDETQVRFDSKNLYPSEPACQSGAKLYNKAKISGGEVW